MRAAKYGDDRRSARAQTRLCSLTRRRFSANDGGARRSPWYFAFLLRARTAADRAAMTPALAAALLAAGLLSAYRVTLNLPDEPFSSALRRPGTGEYRALELRVRDAAVSMFADDAAFQNVTVLQFR